MARASSIAAAVRAGRPLRPSTCVDEHLAAIDGREAEIHAFNLVLADEARAAADGDRRAGWPPARTPARWPACPSRSRTTCAPGASRRRARRGSSRAGGRRTTPPSSSGCAAAGAVVDRQDQPRRVRHGLVAPRTRRSGRPATRTTPTRVPGGSQRRQRRGRGRRVRAAGARLRHRRLDPPAGGAVRRGRRQADVRLRQPLRARRLRQSASTRSARSPPRSPTPRSLLEVIGGHDPLDSTSIPEPRAVAASTRSTTASTACASASITELLGRGHRRRRRRAAREAADALEAGRAPRSTRCIGAGRPSTASPPTT